MWIESLTLKNIRSFADAQLNLSRGINILVGPNSSGKSTIILPLLSLQDGLPDLAGSDIRLGATESHANIQFDQVDQRYFTGKYKSVSLVSEDRTFHLRPTEKSNEQDVSRPRLEKISNREPGNLIYPFLSKRKVTRLEEDITYNSVRNVMANFENLNAKIDRLSNPVLPAHELYMRACQEILGLPITTTSTTNGKCAAYAATNMEHIPLLSMGEGIMSILGLVVSLAIAENKLFLIEEPENDIHPRALKALLELVLEKSSQNQFIITTHSNIVLKRLGSAEASKVFRGDFALVDRLPTSTVAEVQSDPEGRRAVLQDLGYELYDIDLWEAWLILEESSAETVIREFLIPWFAPLLQTRLRTYSAHSLSEVTPKFRDFNDLFVFLHLEPAYKNQVWVLGDGGTEERKIIDDLVALYEPKGWKSDHFVQLKEHDFENYYPDRFADERGKALDTKDKQRRRELKKQLLLHVQDWAKTDPKAAKGEFADSASEVVEFLKTVEVQLDSATDKA